jgi:hypothetical protein
VLAVAAIAIAASARVFANDFAMDDVHLLVNDVRLHSLSGITRMFGEPYWPEPFNRDLYRPLSSVSFLLQWILGGGSPLIFRFVSCALYAAVSVGVLELARRVLPWVVALAVALVFAAHPVHTEAVALGVNQSELWVALLALIATVRYVDARRAAGPLLRDWVLIAALFVVAFLFKEHALAIPGLLLAAELTVVDARPARERVRRLWPGFATLAVLGAAFLAVRAKVLGSFVGSFTASALVGQGIGGRMLTMLQVIPEWLRLLLFPAHLQGDYSTAELERATGWGFAQTAGLVLLAALAALAVLTRRRAPAVPFGLLWTGAALLPISNLIVPTGILMAERTLFLPSVGFLIAVGGFCSELRASPRRITRHAAAYAVAALVLLGVGRSALRYPDWRNHLHFWAQATRDAPLSHKAHYAYGQLLYLSGRRAEGLGEYYKAVSLAPAEFSLQRELGDLFRLRGQCGPALYWYAESLAVEPLQGSVQLSRISCLVQMGRLEEAQREAATVGVGGAAAEPEPRRP